MSKNKELVLSKVEGLIPELRFPEFEGDGEWETNSIGEVFKSFIPFIRSAEINKDATELLITDKGLKNSSAKLVNKGDLLVALYGANSGDSAISKINGTINQAILYLQSEYSNAFIYNFLTLKKDWIVQNADPNKEIVAQGQTYFEVQTRIQEIRQMDEYNRLSREDERRLFLRNELAKHNTQLAAVAKDAAKPLDYAIFQNHGYMGLCGGLNAKAIHTKKALKKSQQILDHIGSTELTANLFRATQAEEKLRRENIKGKQNANKAHFEVGKKVHKTIQELGGTGPEDLPTVDSVKKLERQQAKQLKGKRENDEK